MKKDKVFGRPNLIYLGNLSADNKENPFLQFKNCKNYSSTTYNNTVHELDNLQHINNTNKNNIINKVSQSVKRGELEEIKERCEFGLLEEVDEFGNVNTRKKELVENAIEIMYYSANIKVNNAIIPREIVRNKLKQLNGAKICYALDKLNSSLINTKSVANSTNYLISCIYNAITEYHADAEIQYKIDCLSK